MTRVLLNAKPTYVPFKNLRRAGIRFEGWEQEYVWMVENAASSPFFTELVITLPKRNLETAMSALVDFLASTEARLTSLGIDAGIEETDHDSSDNSLADAITRHADIHTLHLRLPNSYMDNLIRTTGTSKNLKEVSLITQTHGSAVDADAPVFPPLYPSTVSISLILPISQLEAIMHVIKSSTLKAFETTFGFSGTNEQHRCLQILSDIRSMTKIDIQTIEMTLYWTQISSILSSSRLQDVLVGPLYAVDDTHLEAMAKAWPDLRKLEVLDPKQMKVLATFHGITHLAQHCPRLATLSLSIDMTRIAVEDLEALQQGPVCKSVVAVDFGPSIVERYGKNAALWIHRMFPNLQTLRTASEYAESYNGWGWTRRQLKKLGRTL